MVRTLSSLLAFLLAAAPATAAVFEQVAVELSVGAGASVVSVVSGDRVVATVAGAQNDVLTWVDTIDLDLAVQSYDIGASASALLTVEDEGGARLYAAGDQIDVFSFDTSDEPATLAAATPIGLGSNGGHIVALAWDGDRLALYGADRDRRAIRHLAVDGSGSAVDTAAGWPLSLPFEPVDLVMLDADTLVVVGEDGGEARCGIVLLGEDSGPLLLMLSPPAGGAGLPVATAADGEGEGWVLLAGGDLWRVGEAEATGDDDDSVPGDDDSAVGDDDTVAGDDDSASGDDDSSLGDDDSALSLARGAAETDFAVTSFLGLALPTPSADLLWVPRDGGAVLLVSGANLVRTVGTDGADRGTLTLTGSVEGLAVSSAADGHAYVAEPATGLIGVLSVGPHLTLGELSGTTLPSDAQNLTFAFTATLGGTETSCVWSALLDGDITGTGELIPSATGTASHGVAVTHTITGASVTDGQHRIHLRCIDALGGVGRTSFTVYKGSLVAPSNFSATPANGYVAVRFDPSDDASVDHYLVWWGLATFGPQVEPSASNEDGTITSPIEIDAPDVSGDDDSAVTTAERIVYSVQGLTNETTYYFAAAAVDADGNEGPRTEVLSAKPGLTGGAAVLAGETGGCSCETTGAAGSALALILLPFFCRRGRR